MRWLLILLLLAVPASAQTIRVASGEHVGYSRLVLPLPEGTAWQVGRTETGYELALTGEDLRFDLSRVFDLIPKTRLTGIFADPASGRLQLSLSCRCHALPFQLDARTLVIDMRDGPPPVASSFERTLDGAATAPLAAAMPPRPKARPAVPSPPLAQVYDWLARAPITTPVAPVAAPFRPGPAMNPLRDALLRQLSDGAADGVIDLALPPAAVPEATIDDTAQLRVTRQPGLTVRQDRVTPASLMPDGAACLSDAALDLAAWGGSGDAAGQIAQARGALVGEFDRPDQAAVALFVQVQLHFGFGAEAALTLRAFDTAGPDVAIWRSLARIMEGQPQTGSAFAGMAGCDTAAALWALLATAVDARPDGVNVAAVRRAFSALPSHLRQQLGPMLADRALALGEVELAQAVADVAGRGTAMPSGMQALVQAEVDLAAGRFTDAALAMERLLGEAGPTAAEALILLVDARVALGEPVPADLAVTAAAMLREQAGTPLEARLHRARILALAAAGDFDGAFAADPDAAQMPEIWALLSGIGPDAALLAHAVAPPQDGVTLARGVALRMVERLLALGFAEGAAGWLAAMGPDDAVDPLLAARVALAQGDGRAVLRHLAGHQDPAALALKAAAEQLLGRHDLARLTWAVAGDAAASTRAAGWAQDWPTLAAGAPGAWQAAAAAVTRGHGPAAATATGPLAAGQALVADSAKMRADIGLLLQSVPQP